MTSKKNVRRIIIAGSRGFTDYDLLAEKMDEYIRENVYEDEDIIIISGGAKGGDKLGEQYADECGFEIEQYLPDWEGLGKSAGFKRNERMAEVGTDLVAFWDSKSRGTKHMIDTALKKGINVEVCEYERLNEEPKEVKQFKLPSKAWDLLNEMK